MDVIKFRIRHADGRIEELVTEAGRVLIGSGSHCEIRLPVGAARVEHVLIQITPAGWRATARSFDPVPRINGTEFTEAPIVGECILSIEETRIDVYPSADASPNASRGNAKGGVNPRIYAYVVLGIAGWVAMYAGHMAPKAASPEPLQAPPLWAETTEACPQTDPEQAVSAGQTRLAMALSKAERSPFHSEDGVAAVPLYESAAACFRVGGREDAAAEATADALRLRRDVSERFRVHRLRMQRALANEEWSSARHEATLLLAFLSPTRGGEYAAWLSSLRRRLQLRYGDKGERQS